MYSMTATSSALIFPAGGLAACQPRAKPWQALPAGEVRRACGAAHLRLCLMLWCKDMNTGALQLVGVISVLVINPALPLVMAYRMISLSCQLFFLSDMTAGDFPRGNRGCHALHRASKAVSARPSGAAGFIPLSQRQRQACCDRSGHAALFNAPFPALSAPRQTDAGL